MQHGGGVAGLARNRTAAASMPFANRGTIASTPTANSKTTSTQQGKSMLSGVRYRPDELSPVSSFASRRPSAGPQLGASPRPRTRRRRTAAPRLRTARCTPGRRPPATARCECRRCRRSSPTEEAAERRQIGQPERGQQREPGQEHPRVADGGEREQPFNVPLAEAEQRPDDGGDDVQHQEQVRDPSAVPERVAEHRPVDPCDPVEAALDHHPGEQHADGVGATACTPASQKWNGTIAARQPPAPTANPAGGNARRSEWTADRGQRCTAEPHPTEVRDC